MKQTTEVGVSSRWLEAVKYNYNCSCQFGDGIFNRKLSVLQKPEDQFFIISTIFTHWEIIMLFLKFLFDFCHQLQQERSH